MMKRVLLIFVILFFGITAKPDIYGVNYLYGYEDFYLYFVSIDGTTGQVNNITLDESVPVKYISSVTGGLSCLTKMGEYYFAIEPTSIWHNNVTNGKLGNQIPVNDSVIIGTFGLCVYDPAQPEVFIYTIEGKIWTLPPEYYGFSNIINSEDQVFYFVSEDKNGTFVIKTVDIKTKKLIQTSSENVLDLITYSSKFKKILGFYQAKNNDCYMLKLDPINGENKSIKINFYNIEYAMIQYSKEEGLFYVITQLYHSFNLYKINLQGNVSSPVKLDLTKNDNLLSFELYQ